MKPVRSATLREITARGVELDCGHGLLCRVSILGPDLGRVLFRRAEGFRARKSWSVLRPGLVDTPWQGLDRDDESGWPEGLAAVEQYEDEIRLVAPEMIASIRLAPFGIVWSLPDGTVFARERQTHPVMFGRNRILHAFERDRGDRYFGLGDKTGPLDLHGRRLRIAMRDSLGYDPERGDPMYKHWPFLIAVDGQSGVASGVFYDNLAEAAVDLGCEHDNYYGLFRTYEAGDGDLDYYVFPGPGVVDVTRKFLALTGRPPKVPRWTLGFSQTAMALAESPNGQERSAQFIDRCIADQIPISGFHVGSGYTMIGAKRYVFTWNRSKYPEPEAMMRRFAEAGMRVVANIKPCLLDDHPRYQEPQAGYVMGDDGKPVMRQFWDGEGAHLDFTNPIAVAWWQGGVSRDVLATGITAGWNDNNEYGFDDETAICEGFGLSVTFNLARPVQCHLMSRATLEATLAHAPDERGFTISRAGMPGIQRYAQSWSGDNETSWRGLAWGVRTGLTMSLSGGARRCAGGDPAALSPDAVFLFADGPAIRRRHAAAFADIRAFPRRCARLGGLSGSDARPQCARRPGGGSGGFAAACLSAGRAAMLVRFLEWRAICRGAEHHHRSSLVEIAAVCARRWHCAVGRAGVASDIA